MIGYLVKLAVRLVVLVAAFFALGFLAAHVAGADDLRDRHCNPYTYGRPHSCHVAPVEFVNYWAGHFGYVKVAPWGTWR